MDTSYCQIPKATKVLVTGATGFTGSWLVAKLAEAGLNVRAIARESSDRSRLSSLPIEWFLGNVYDREVVEEAAQGAEYIFNVAAAYRQVRIANEEYHRVHVSGTQLLAQAALRNPRFKRFVQISTVGVHGHIDNPPADESALFAPTDIYQRTKLTAELWLREFAEANKLHYAIIRPTAIYGPGDKRLLKFFKMATWPVFPFLGFGQGLFHLVHVDDLTNVILLSATHAAADREVFICGNAEAIRLADMARVIAGMFGRSPSVLRLPAAPFFLAAAICELLCKPLGIEPPLYRRRVAFFTKDSSFNTTKLREKLGYHTKYSNEEGLLATARWYVEHGWLR